MLYGFVDVKNPYIGDVTCSIPIDCISKEDDETDVENLIHNWKRNWKQTTYVSETTYKGFHPSQPYVTVSFTAHMEIFNYLELHLLNNGLIPHFANSMFGLIHYCRLCVLNAFDVAYVCNIINNDRNNITTINTVLESLEAGKYDPGLCKWEFGGITIENELRATAHAVYVIDHQLETVAHTRQQPGAGSVHPMFAEYCGEIITQEVNYWSTLKRYALLYNSQLRSEYAYWFAHEGV